MIPVKIPEGAPVSESTLQLLAQCRQLIAQDPLVPDYHNYLGEVYRHLGQWENAIQAYDTAIALKNDFAEAHNNRGIVLDMIKRRPEAEEAFRRALMHRPIFPKAWNNLGILMGLEGRSEDAIHCFTQSLLQEPKNDTARGNLANLFSIYGQTEDALAWYRQILHAGDATMCSNYLLALHYASDYTPEAIWEQTQAWARRFAEPIYPRVRPHTNDRDPERRLRIGFVSPDFSIHPVGHFLDALFGAFDREHVEVHAYSDCSVPDEMTERIRAKADVWSSVVGMQSEELANLIRQDQIDILVDTTGHTGNNRLLMLAEKPAPIQIAHFGYPDSTGLKMIDYRITDAVADPPGTTEQWHSEKLLRLPRFAWLYRQPHNAGDPGTPPFERNGYITFGSLNNFAKANRRTRLHWLTLLKRVAGSKLFLLVNQRRAVSNHLLNEAKEMGVSEDRLIIRERSQQSGYFQLFHEVDIALDPYPYHGGVTTCDTLYMGVPVVSQYGPTYFCRQGLAILSHVGLADLAASTEERLMELTCALADDSARLRSLRKELRSRLLDSPIMDSQGFAEELVQAYRDVWRQWTRQ
jgi:predicted O-linked N-acetylglucosamine transferase (SPINDLY family)